MAANKSTWTHSAIETAVGAIESRATAPSGCDEQETELRHLIARGDLTKSGVDRLRTLALILAVLRRQVRQRSMPLDRMLELVDLAETFFRLEGINASTSLLSHYHGELAGVRSFVHASRSLHGEAAWAAFDADRVAMRSTDEPSEAKRLLMMGERALRLGQSRLALELLNVVAASASGAMREAALLLIVDALRLSGDAAGARDVATSTLADAKLSEPASLSFKWRLLVMDFVRTGNPIPFLRQTARGEAFFRADQLVDMSLYLRAGKARGLFKDALKPRTIKRGFPDETAAAKHELHFAIQCLEAIDTAYDTTLPLEARLKPLTDAFAGRQTFLSVERELLLLAALARCLSRLRQDGFAALVTGEYRKLSLAMSSGDSSDVLQQAGDLLDRPWYRAQDHATEPLADELVTSMATGRIGRSARFGRMTAQIAGTVVTGSLRRLLATKAEKTRLTALQSERIGNILAKNLGSLRGACMKLGQMMSLSNAAMPPSVRTVLGSLQDKAPEAPYQTMRGVFIEEFGKSPEEVFAAWDVSPLASGSIGQVYRAKTLEGEDVCVKIQYPGIEQTIRDDISNLGMLLPLARFLGHHTDFAALLHEVGSVISSECDYVAEAHHQTRFAELFKGDPHVRIPEVLPQYSAKRVITTQFVDGLGFKDFIASATESERQLAANSIFSAGLRCFFDHGLVNVDTNPGNFLFKDGQVFFIDFGCVKQWDLPFRNAWLGMLSAVLDNDAVKMKRHLDAIDHIVDAEKFDVQWEVDMARIVLNLDKDTSEKVDAAAIRSLIETAIQGNPNAAHMRINPSSMFMYRSIWGLFALLCELDVNDDWRRLLRDKLYPNGHVGIKEAG